VVLAHGNSSARVGHTGLFGTTTAIPVGPCGPARDRANAVGEDCGSND
jgi:hypothetical protein